MANAAGKSLRSERVTQSATLAATLADAAVPSCLKPDALKQDEPRVGPVGLGGALPALFLIHAAATGKCKG